MERLRTRLPITKVVVEVAKFDIQKINTPEIQCEQYQQGEQLGYANITAYIRHRDGYECQNPNCKNKTSPKILQVHHIGFWKLDRSNRPGNLITLCDKCHTPANHKKGKLLHGWKPKVKSFKPETFMSIIYRRLVETLGGEQAFGNRSGGDQKNVQYEITRNQYENQSRLDLYRIIVSSQKCYTGLQIVF